MRIKVQRVKKGTKIAQQVKGGYVHTVTDELGYLIYLGAVSAFIPDSLFKEARSCVGLYPGFPVQGSPKMKLNRILSIGPDDTIGDLVKRLLEINGFEGLYNADFECGCQLDDLVPCAEDCTKCRPGFRAQWDAEEECWLMGAEKVKKQ